MRIREWVTTGRPHPVHAILLGFPIALFTSGVVTDIAYLRTAQIQWTNFSAWLIVGALIFTGVVFAWALASLILGYRGVERRPRALYAAILGAAFLLGLINAFKHSQDAWSSVGALGLILSILCALLALAAGVLAFSDFGLREDAR